jgi:hypothetical protein
MQLDQGRAIGWDPPWLNEREINIELWGLVRCSSELAEGPNLTRVGGVEAKRVPKRSMARSYAARNAALPSSRLSASPPFGAGGGRAGLPRAMVNPHVNGLWQGPRSHRYFCS